ncbi:MAG: hypothetical protein JKY23_01290 [Nitrospinaceae bacterium]|nr:hypothetical protein [Nitrospinaceae bacterium]
MMNSNLFFLFRILILPPLAGFLTFLCLEYDFKRALEGIDLIFFGGLFFVFAITINTANLRRFQAIDELAILWSVAMSYWQTGKRHLTGQDQEKLQHELREFFEKLRFLMHEKVVGEEAKNKLLEIDNFFNELSLIIESFRKTEKIGEPELACLLNWLEQMYSSFEKLLAIKEHRTPRSLRLFIDWALVLGELLLTPQFAMFGLYGVFSITLIMGFLITLIKIQKLLEYPFGKKIDHIDLRLKEKAYRRIA